MRRGHRRHKVRISPQCLYLKGSNDINVSCSVLCFFHQFSASWRHCFLCMNSDLTVCVVVLRHHAVSLIIYHLCHCVVSGIVQTFVPDIFQLSICIPWSPTFHACTDSRRHYLPRHSNCTHKPSFQFPLWDVTQQSIDISPLMWAAVTFRDACGNSLFI